MREEDVTKRLKFILAYGNLTEADAKLSLTAAKHILNFPKG
jgi:hypothetical protein